MPEPHIQLAAAGLTALRRADAGDPVGALSGLRLTTARLGGSAPPALADRLLQVEADLLRRIGDVSTGGRGAGRVARPGHSQLRAGRGPPAPVHRGPRGRRARRWPSSPDDGATVRGRVEGAVLRSLIAAPQDRAAALSRLEDALLAAAPLGMRRPFLVEAARAARRCSPPGSKPGPAVAAFAVDLMRRMSGTGAADRRPYWPRR